MDRALGRSSGGGRLIDGSEVAQIPGADGGEIGKRGGGLDSGHRLTGGRKDQNVASGGRVASGGQSDGIQKDVGVGISAGHFAGSWDQEYAPTDNQSRSGCGVFGYSDSASKGHEASGILGFGFAGDGKNTIVNELVHKALGVTTRRDGEGNFAAEVVSFSRCDGRSGHGFYL
jgi:hypothetical protein